MEKRWKRATFKGGTRQKKKKDKEGKRKKRRNRESKGDRLWFIPRDAHASTSDLWKFSR